MPNEVNVSTNPFTEIKVTDIEWITKKGGLPSDKNWVVLFPQKDSDKIAKIINLVNSSSKIGKSTEEDMNFLRRKHGYPVDIVIRVKDGSEFSLKSAMELTTRQTTNGTGTTGTTYKDRFILAYDKNSTTVYYTAFSNDAAEYILDAHNPDFPRVDGFSITPETLTPGIR